MKRRWDPDVVVQYENVTAMQYEIKNRLVFLRFLERRKNRDGLRSASGVVA